ncbi:hypothetical protein DEH84_13375 [Aquabacterium olei]|uniref:TM2 domain-containing protein n=1 Tax=Aquabacterium olei TaxID=1296669 RepID=A0A2U8FTC9_9BURK|nr:NINE protein [Aquabacterium olei]AWI54303.1 hypothetical protein DEH84_13375 [Aquabacterium olei]
MQVAPTPAKSKTLATWLAFLVGTLGLHRFYLHGLRDRLGWALPVLTLIGLAGLRRVEQYGQDDVLSWLLLPVLGFTVAGTMLQAILYGLTPDARWHARHNPDLTDPAAAPHSGWAAVIAVILALMVGATVLMATIAFSGQRYFEYQVEEARKISQ